jgi:cyclopropane-fatty-acyl-phospholipid synthase
MDGWFECKDLETMVFKLLAGRADKEYKKLININNIIDVLKVKLSKSNNPYDIGNHHYDMGNQLYEAMLGKTMAYSCGYFADKTDDLDEAQTAKFELICQKLQLQGGENVLDIGCGFGSLGQYMAEKYNVNVTGLTVSKEQKKYAEKHFADDRMKIHLVDYEEFMKMNKVKYDKIVSVGMFEHVGLKNYEKFIRCCFEMLADDGLFLLHTCGNRFTDDGFEPWIEKYIFPAGKIPSLKQILNASDTYFEVQHVQNFGLDYEKTLNKWLENFENNWGDIKENYGDRFFRMWRYYLCCCAAAFKVKNLHLLQIVYTKYNYPKIYQF